MDCVTFNFDFSCAAAYRLGLTCHCKRYRKRVCFLSTWRMRRVTRSALSLVSLSGSPANDENNMSIQPKATTRINWLSHARPLCGKNTGNDCPNHSAKMALFHEALFQSSTRLCFKTPMNIPHFPLLLAALAIVIATTTAPTAAQTNQARTARQQALAKERRIIFNDDTHELDRGDANTPEGFLRRRLKPLVGTPVDVISWSILGGLFDAPVYDSKIQPVYGDAHPEPPSYYPGMTKNVRALIDSGHCPLQIVIDFAHETTWKCSPRCA